MPTYQSAEERLLDDIIASILGEYDRNDWWVLSYEEARMIAKNYQELCRGTTMVKYRTVIGMLGQVGERQFSVWTIMRDNDAVPEKARDDLIGKALLIMMVHYRSSFLRLMKQWRRDPDDYIRQYERHN
jgi:hypothetical protein